MRFCLSVAAGIALIGCETQVADPLAPTDPLVYRVDYEVTVDPAIGSAGVRMRVSQSQPLLREFSFTVGGHLSDVTAGGELTLAGDRATWRPGERGGEISWQVAVPHRRNASGYDAWLGPDFGLFRAEDIIPRAASRAAKDARSETTMTFRVPAGWSVVTQYHDDDGRFRIDNPERRLDQPSGWIVIGDLGVRRDQIAGVSVVVAGPVGHSVRRLDTLALLNWTLPRLAAILPELPSRITIISAGDPMWRGGLSAPESLYIHAERPLISENATSTLLHEILHLSLGVKADKGYDWIVEGLAEYYSLQLLHRSGTITTARYEGALADLESWASQAERLCAPTSSGPTTALAVGVFGALDSEIRAATGDTADLDELVRALWHRDDDVDADVLRDLATELIGDKPDALHSDRLPGCRNIAAGSA